MEGREYSNYWISTVERPEECPVVRVVLSKWSPPKERKIDEEYMKQLVGAQYPCWQDEPARPYTYTEWNTKTGRVCPWEQGHHFAPETFNLDADNFAQPESHWCYDANVSRTPNGILSYLNWNMSGRTKGEDAAGLPIIHIVVNSNDWGRSTVSLDLAFPADNCDSYLPRFEDDVLFVGEYAKGRQRGRKSRFDGIDLWNGKGCPICWEDDELSMRVYSRHPASVGKDSNGRRGEAKEISKKDVENAEAAGDEWIIYDFSVEFVGGQKLRIAFPTWIMKEITGANWNTSSIKVYPLLDA